MAIPFVLPVALQIARHLAMRRLASAGAQRALTQVGARRVFANPGGTLANRGLARQAPGQLGPGAPGNIPRLLRPRPVRSPFGRVGVNPINPKLKTIGMEAEIAAYGGATNTYLRNREDKPRRKQVVAGDFDYTKDDVPFTPYSPFQPTPGGFNPYGPATPTNPYEGESGPETIRREDAPPVVPTVDPRDRARTYPGVTPSTPVAPSTSAPATPPASPPVVDPTEEITAAGAEARVNVAGIQRQYDNILRELSSMYQLAETEEEKERLRYMLADIEAQRDAGLQAIETGYADTVATIRARGVTSAAEGTARAQQYGDQIRGTATDLEQRLVDRQAAQVAGNRGLGSGMSDPMNEWVGLINAMAPAQQGYTQAMSDINVEGINWLGDVTASQGQAQAADLSRLAAATRSTATMGHMDRVADRIAQERAEQRAAMMQIMMASAGATQSAGQFNASQAGREADIRRAQEREAAEGRQGQLDTIWSLGATYGYSDEAIARFVQERFGRQITPEELAIARDARQIYINEQTRNNPPLNNRGNPYDASIPRPDGT